MRRVQNRSAEILQTLIREHVHPGSIICTDLWKGYSAISESLKMEHRTVNHSMHFKDPITGTNTNTVEGNNNALKIMIEPRNRTKNIDEHLSEFVWRRKNASNLWGAFIHALKDVHYNI